MVFPAFHLATLVAIACLALGSASAHAARGPGIRCRLSDVLDQVSSRAYEKYLYQVEPRPRGKTDVLELARNLPPQHRADYTKWVTSLRSENPPIRGRDVYERVVLSAIRNRGNKTAMLDTWIPFDEGEGALPWISENIARFEFCTPTSLCRKLVKDPPLDRLEQLRTELQATIARAKETGYLSYRDYLEASHTAVVLADFASPVPSDPVARHQVESFFATRWTRDWQVSSLQNFENNLMAGRANTLATLNHRIPIITTRAMDEAEVTVAGYATAPLELVTSWSPVDNTSAPPSVYFDHDLGHANRMARADAQRKDYSPEPVDFGDIGFQLQMLQRWQSLRSEFEARSLEYPEFKPLFGKVAYRRRHEKGVVTDLAGIGEELIELSKEKKYEQNARLLEFATKFPKGKKPKND
jgi:hypothetical protein